jgi:hypothetical protein
VISVCCLKAFLQLLNQLNHQWDDECSVEKERIFRLGLRLRIASDSHNTDGGWDCEFPMADQSYDRETCFVSR